MSLSQLTSAHLKKVAKLVRKKEGFLAKVRVIEDELESLVSGITPKSERKPRKRRTMSPETRAKMAAAQQKRRAKAKSAPVKKGPF